MQVKLPILRGFRPNIASSPTMLFYARFSPAFKNYESGAQNRSYSPEVLEHVKIVGHVRRGPVQFTPPIVRPFDSVPRVVGFEQAESKLLKGVWSIT